jgi:cobalt-zinc-cadmium efflux system outer membrane protein
MVVGGCAPASVSDEDAGELVATEIRERSGLAEEGLGAGDFSALSSGESLSESRAVDLALANNAAFAEQLAGLGLSRADVVQAGLITNPDALLLIPVGPKQLEATITAPLEALWLRGQREQAAQAAYDRTAARLTQLGLDLVRDVRLAYADLALARARLGLFEESAKLRRQVAGIAQSRVNAGDAVPLDAATANIDALQAEQDAASLRYAVDIAEERLRAAVGAGAVRTRIVTSPSPDGAADWDVEELLRDALAGRPDMKAAEMMVEEARRREALAKIEWFNLSFVADANERGSKGFEAGPGFRFTLPIFNHNQGAIARAKAMVQQAIAQKRTLNDRIILEVREAHARFVQAREDLRVRRELIVPELEKAVKLAENAYRNGETPLVQVLDVNRQLLDARVREAQAEADARRARAELERSVGRRLERRTPASMPRRSGHE